MSIPVGGFTFDLGGCFQLIQEIGISEGAFAAELGVAWRNRAHWIGFLGRYSSAKGDTFSAFLPINTITQGHILRPKLSGIAIFNLEYTVRLHPILSFSFIPAYYINTASQGYNIFGNQERLLGAEFYGSLAWVPLSDVMINLSGGIFMPSAPETKNLWQAGLGLILSLR